MRLRLIVLGLIGIARRGPTSRRLRDKTTVLPASKVARVIKHDSGWNGAGYGALVGAAAHNAGWSPRRSEASSPAQAHIPSNRSAGAQKVSTVPGTARMSP